jgi:hypothetical protein
MTVLGFTVMLDIVIAVGDKSQPEGSAARKGGISMLFFIEWKVPETDILIGSILGSFDLTPFNFDLFTKEGLKAGFSELTVAFSLEIVPTIVNKIMAVAGDIIKIALKVILWPIITLAAESMDALNEAADWLEEKIQAFKETYESTKEELERVVGAAKDEINAKRQELMETKSELRSLDPKIRRNKKKCEEPCNLHVGWCCAHCSRHWRNGNCAWWNIGHPTSEWIPNGCGWRQVARAAACVAWGLWVVAKETAEFVLDLCMVALDALMAAIQLLMDAILLILKGVELLMMGAKEALLAAAQLIGIVVMPLKFIDAFAPCIGCATIDQVCFWDAYDTVPLMSIETFAVGGSFSMATVAFDAVIEFMILGTEKQISISFSLDAKSLLMSFGEFCADFFKGLMGGEKQSFFCETEESVTSSSDAVDSATKDAAEAEASANEMSNNVGRRLLTIDAADAEDEMFSAFLRRHGHVLTGRSVDPDDKAGGLGMNERGKYYARTSLRGLEIVSTSQGGLAEPAAVEVKRHASVTAHVAAILARTPAHRAALSAAARMADMAEGNESSTVAADAGLAALLATPLADVRFAEAVGASSAFQAAALGSPQSTRGALDALAADIGLATSETPDREGHVVGDALRAAPSVTAACFPDMKAPLLAAVAAIAGYHAAEQANLNGVDVVSEKRPRSRPRAAGVPETNVGFLGNARWGCTQLHPVDPSIA